MKMITKLIYAAVALVSLALGVATASAAMGDLFASINGRGNGEGFIYKYTPTGVQSVFASGLSRPRGVAFFGANLFVSTSTFDGVNERFEASIVKITPGGLQSTFATLSGDDLFAEGVTFDRAGNLFVVAIDNTDPNISSIIYKITPGRVQSTFGSLPGQGFGLAFDSANNLFAAVNYTADPSEVWKFAPDGTPSVFVRATDAVTGFDDLAFDRFGNLFVSSFGASGSGSILKFTPNGTESTFATNLMFPRGLAFDTAGNLLVAEIFTDVAGAPGNILKFTPGGNQTLFASEIAQPEFLAFQLPPTPPRPH